LNNSRESLTLSKISSIPYYERMQIQNDKLSWSKQVEINVKENLSLSYATPREGVGILVNEILNNSPNKEEQCVNNKAPALNDISVPQDEKEANNTTNICSL